MDANSHDRLTIPDETVKAIERGEQVGSRVAYFVDSMTGWPALAMEPGFFEHFVSQVGAAYKDCETCRGLIQALSTNAMEWRQEPEGWILRFPRRSVDD